MKFLLSFGYFNNYKANLTKRFLSSVIVALLRSDWNAVNVTLSWPHLPAGSARTREVQLIHYCRECTRVLKLKQVCFKDCCFGMVIGGRPVFESLVGFLKKMFGALVDWKRYFGTIGGLFVHIFMSKSLCEYAFS